MSKKASDYKAHYKEINPEKTVNRLIQILENNEIDVEEHWMDVSEIDTYSLRLTLKGTNIGTNGKGVSPQYARASAYAEFLERLQNELLWGDQWSKGLRSLADKEVKTAKELVVDNSSFIDYYFKVKGIVNNADKIANILTFEKFEEFMTNKRDHFTSVPFYNFTKNKVEYLPRSIYLPYYGSNGMCAGNTCEEALVQGISEIIERVVQRRAFKESITFPDIPEDKIKSYPYIWEMYERIKKMGTVDILLKDCSFGGKYPVVGLIVIQKNTGMYGVKFGCHPIISIAMERTLTEATQGQKVIKYSCSSKMDFTNKEVIKNYNIENSQKVGMAQYPYQLFNDKPTYQYSETKDFTGYSNKEILVKWLFELKEEGYNILIRDSSYLDFPTYHIIIPGLSEMRDISDSFLRGYNTRMVTTWLLSNKSQINSQNCKYISGTIEKYAMNIQENGVREFFGKIDNQKLPAEEFGCERSFLCAMCYCMQEKYEKAEFYFEQIEREAIKSQNNPGYYIAIHYYISAMKEWKSHNKAMFYIQRMFDDHISKRINQIFTDKEKIILHLYGNIKSCGLSRNVFIKKFEKMKCDKVLKQEQIREIIK